MGVRGTTPVSRKYKCAPRVTTAPVEITSNIIPDTFSLKRPLAAFARCLDMARIRLINASSTPLISNLPAAEARAARNGCSPALFFGTSSPSVLHSINVAMYGKIRLIVGLTCLLSFGSRGVAQSCLGMPRSDVPWISSASFLILLLSIFSTEKV